MLVEIYEIYIAIDLRQVSDAFRERFGRIPILMFPMGLFIYRPNGTTLKLNLSLDDIDFMNSRILGEEDGGERGFGKLRLGVLNMKSCAICGEEKDVHVTGEKDCLRVGYEEGVCEKCCGECCFRFSLCEFVKRLKE